MTITALITGRGDSEKHLWRVLGRALCEYPIIAAKESGRVERVYFSTDGAEMQAIAKSHGVEVIDRPAKLARADSLHVECLEHALGRMARPDILVVLLANVAIHHWGLVDRCIEKLEGDADASACVPVVRRERYGPASALRLGAEVDRGEEYTAHEAVRWSEGGGRAVFLTHSVWVLRVSECFGAGAGPWGFMGDRVLPLEVDCDGDVHSEADIMPAEKWLVGAGWTEDLTLNESEQRHWRDFVRVGEP